MELRSLGRYELRGELGRGTMGVVYRGFDPVLERELALKTVRLSLALPEAERETYLSRFFREARIAAKLLHPNIVVTHDAATEQGIPFIAMELVSGGSLRERVAAGPIPWRDAVKLVAPVAAALDYAHEEGIVHRDVKPANVLMTKAGVAKLADFGIARLPSSELTESGALMGTPYYMSPEQLEGDDIDGRSDVYALGALFYALVAGKPPFTGADLATITKQVLYKDPLPLSESVPDVPAGLDGVVARALVKRADERYASGADFAAELERLVRGEPPRYALALGERTIESVGKVKAQRSRDRSLALESVPAADAPPTASASASASPRGAGLLVPLLGLVLVLALGWNVVPKGVEGFLDDREEIARRGEISFLAGQELERAQELGSRGHWREAHASVERAHALYRDAIDGRGEAAALLARGRLFAAEGRWSDARTDFDAAAAVSRIYRGDLEATAHVALADLERDRGSFERADALYERALAEGAGSEALVGRALLLIARGELEAARETLERIPRFDSRRPRAELYLGAIAFADADVDGAERHWSLAAEGLDVAEVDLWRGYASLALGRDEDALVLFRAALESFDARDHRTGMSSAREGLEGRKLASRLGTLFLAAPRTAGSEALAEVLALRF